MPNKYGGAFMQCLLRCAAGATLALAAGCASSAASSSAIAAASPVPAATTTSAAPVTLTLLAYDSFTPSAGIFDAVTQETGIEVQLALGGDAGELVTKAALTAGTPEGVYQVARKGYDVMTTPLAGSHERLLQQVEGFKRGRAEAGLAGRPQRLSLQRGVFATKDDAQAKRIVALAHEYYKRFDNIKGPGVVKNGLIEPLPRQQTVEELGRNLLVCSPAELVDRLSEYAELGIDEVLTPCGYGQPHGETIEMMHRFAEEVMPHFRQPKRAIA